MAGWEQMAFIKKREDVRKHLIEVLAELLEERGEAVGEIEPGRC